MKIIGIFYLFISIGIIIYLYIGNKNLRKNKITDLETELYKLKQQIKNEKDILNELFETHSEEEFKFEIYREKQEEEFEKEKKQRETELKGLIALTKAKQDSYNNLLSSQEELIRRDLQIYKEKEYKKLEEEFKEYEGKRYFEVQLFDKQESERRAQYLEETNKIKAELDEYYLRQQSINEAILAKRKLEENSEFHKLQFSEADIDDMKSVLSFKDKFHNKEILSKAVYECYIKKPYNELIKRLCLGKKISGIYKITYEPTGEIYIGRSVDIAERWKQHIKTSMGIGTLASSSLHTHMEKHGLWNYTFEILEEKKENLNESEKYYIDFYQSDKYGFNMKAGG